MSAISGSKTLTAIAKHFVNRKSFIDNLESSKFLGRGPKFLNHVTVVDHYQ